MQMLIYITGKKYMKVGTIKIMSAKFGTINIVGENGGNNYE